MHLGQFANNCKLPIWDFFNIWHDFNSVAGPSPIINKDPVPILSLIFQNLVSMFGSGFCYRARQCEVQGRKQKVTKIKLYTQIMCMTMTWQLTANGMASTYHLLISPLYYRFYYQVHFLSLQTFPKFEGKYVIQTPCTWFGRGKFIRYAFLPQPCTL